MTKIYFYQCLYSTWPQICTETELCINKKWFSDILFNNYIITTNQNEADIIISECTAPLILSDKLNIILCGESDNKYRYSSIIKQNEKDNVKFIGTLEDSKYSFNLPVFCSSWFDIDKLHKYDYKSFCQRYQKNNKQICFMRHLNKIHTTVLRESFSQKFNTVTVNGFDKLDIISEYTFNFCSENSKSEYNGTNGYITEKIIDSIKANCIPIYYGGNLQKYTPFNINRIIQFDEYNIESVINMINSFTESDIKELYNLEILNSDYIEFIEDRKTKLKKFIYG